MKIENQRDLAPLKQWLMQALNCSIQLEAIPQGAGLRRYYRLKLPNEAYVVMDDSRENSQWERFVQLTQFFQNLGVNVPQIYAKTQGWLVLSDFGNQQYYQVLNTENVDYLYGQAFKILMRLHASGPTESIALKPFDFEHYRFKIRWFYEFYLKRFLKMQLSSRQTKILENSFDLLIESANGQPKTCVHYDFHSRNLMVLPNGETGLLDFQDAVWGPVTYDLMALLRDCYINWPSTEVKKWVQQYHTLALVNGLVSEANPETWQKWCDFSSLQRHIKCIGLFARFEITQHSSDYLIYIPRLLAYCREITPRYPELAKLNDLLGKLP